MNARKWSGRLAYARNTLGTKPIFARVSSQIARMSSGMSSSGGAPKREGTAACAAPSLNGGWLLGRDDIPAGDIDRGLLGRLVHVDRVRRLLELRDRHALDRPLGLPVVHGFERVRRLRVELFARPFVDVGRLVHVAAARHPQPDDEPLRAVEQRGCPGLAGLV